MHILTFCAMNDIFSLRSVKNHIGTNTRNRPLCTPQNDVVAIVNESGTAVVTYKYDAWGVVIGSTDTSGMGLREINPITYRSYYYDKEVGFYYLNSRYYAQYERRFVSADSVVSKVGGDVLGYNMFAYCQNNPVNMSDKDGNWPKLATIGLVVGAALCIAAVSILTCGVGTATLAGAIAVGAAKGALIGAAIGTVAGAGIGYATTGTLEGAAAGAAIGFGAGAVVGAVVGASTAASSWYSSKALEFTNAGSKEVVLGRSGTYEPVAQSRGSTYFHATETRWNEVHDMLGVGDKGMWKINKAFLDQQISTGSTFALANNPITSGGYYFQKEVAYLISKGVTLIPIW